MWDYVTYIALAALVLNLIVTIVGGTWKLSHMEIAMLAAINKARDEIEEKVDRQGREFGETAHALREKIVQVELFARDTFMRRDSFLSIQAELKESVAALGMKIDTRLERMEAKIDSKHDH